MRLLRGVVRRLLPIKCPPDSVPFDKVPARRDYAYDFHSAFGPAPVFDPKRLVNDLAVRHDAAKAKHAKLQTDPFALRDAMARVQQREGYDTADERTQRIWQEDALYRPLAALDCSGVALKMAEGALDSWTTHKDDIQRGRPLPLDYCTALEYLEAALILQQDNQLENLRVVLEFESPVFRDKWKEAESGKQGWWKAWNENKLFWCLHMIAAEQYSHGPAFARPLSIIVHSADVLMKAADGRDRRRIDQEIFDHLSNIPMIDEALTALKLHTPRGGPPLTLQQSKVLISPICRQQESIATPALWKACKRFMCTPVPSNPSTFDAILKLETFHVGAGVVWAHLRQQLEAPASTFKELLKEPLFKAMAEQRGITAKHYHNIAKDRVDAFDSKEYRKELQTELAALRAAAKARGIIYNSFPRLTC